MKGQELAKFHRRIRRVDLTRIRMEALADRALVSKNDIESLYEGLFLRAVTSFESFIEELFVAVMMGQTTHPPTRAKSLIHVARKLDLVRILTRDGDYIDWLPYDRTVKRANLYLKSGRPFSELDDGEKSKLGQITRIRNAIAHKSDHAMDQFKKRVIGNMTLLNKEKSPAGFLRSQFRSSPRQLRFEMYLGELGRIASKLN